MTKYKKCMLFLLLSFSTFIFWGNGIYYGQFLIKNYQAVSVRITDGDVTVKQLQQALENEKEKGSEDIPVVTAWTRSKQQIITYHDLKTSASFYLTTINGDMSQACPVKLLRGSIPVNDDLVGCLITEDLAYQLYHTTDVVGTLIPYQQKQYIIRGVCKAPQTMLMIHITDENTAYSNLELIYENKDNGEAMADAFLYQNALASQYTIIDGCFYASLLEMVYQAPAWLLGFYLLLKLLRIIWYRKTLPLQVLLLLIVLIIAWFTIRWLMEFQVFFPERLTPTKWSDFTFWSGIYDDFHSKMQQIDYLLPMPKDVLLRRYVKRCLADSIIALFAIFLFIIHRKVIIPRGMGLQYCLLIILVEIAAVLLLYKTGKPFHLTKGYLAMLPLFIMMMDFRIH